MNTLTRTLKGGRVLAMAAALTVTLLAAAPAQAHGLDILSQTRTFADEIKECVEDVADKATTRTNRSAIVEEAKKYRGVPYAYGGTTPAGFDCSGFTSWVFREALGIELPRTAAEQGELGKSVAMDKLKKGDLLFWGQESDVYHVGIYIGGGKYIHASTGASKIQVTDFQYHAPTFAKRVI